VKLALKTRYLGIGEKENENAECKKCKQREQAYLISRLALKPVSG